MAKDPICGMNVDEKTASLKSEYQGKTYYFCAPTCKQAFDKEPGKYIQYDTISLTMNTRGIERLRLRISGVTCASCIVPVRHALEKTNGVRSVGSNYLADLIIVDYDPEAITGTEIIELIGKVGYNAIPIHR